MRHFWASGGGIFFRINRRCRLRLLKVFIGVEGVFGVVCLEEGVPLGLILSKWVGILMWRESTSRVPFGRV